MANKFYRTKKDNFLWEAGAILESVSGGYAPKEDVWDVSEHIGSEYISTCIVENSPEWFERVYPVSAVGQTVYVLKEKMKEMLSKSAK